MFNVRFLLVGVLCCLISNTPGFAASPIKVITTTTVLKDLTQVVGGDQVQVEHLIKPFTDPHLVKLTPRDLLKIRNSDLFVKVGGDEEEWTFGAVESAGNPDLVVVDTSFRVNYLEVPTEEELRQAQGGTHLHKSGNPYYWLNPKNVPIMLDNIVKGLSWIRPDQKPQFVKNANAYIQQLNEWEKTWQSKVQPLQRYPMVAYHKTWAYLAHSFGLNIVAHIEPQPGISPSLAYWSRLLQTMKSQQVQLMLIEPYYVEKKAVQTLQAETGSQIVVLTISIGPAYQTQTYLDMMERNLRVIQDAVKQLEKNG